MRALSFVGTGVKSCLLMLGVLLASSGAGASSPTVALGEVTSQVPRNDLPRTFRETVKSELSRVDLSEVSSKEHFVLSASLVRMNTRAGDGETESTAVVSATLRRERGGDLTAIIRGSARATDESGKSRVAERSAMRAAVRSALSRLPEALR
jgi:hypothetical protein